MTSEPRRGLRLVELIVVFLIAVMLLPLLVSYLSRSRFHDHTSRRRACLNNQKQFALGLLRYESRQGRFPGYRNHLNDDVQGNPVIASWLVMLFPHVEQNHLWQLWNDPQVLAAEKPVMDWELFMCPADAALRQGGSDHAMLSYVVNCGKPGDLDTPAEGIFHDHGAKTEPVPSC